MEPDKSALERQHVLWMYGGLVQTFSHILTVARLLEENHIMSAGVLRILVSAEKDLIREFQELVNSNQPKITA